MSKNAISIANNFVLWKKKCYRVVCSLSEVEFKKITLVSNAIFIS